MNFFCSSQMYVFPDTMLIYTTIGFVWFFFKHTKNKQTLLFAIDIYT